MTDRHSNKMVARNFPIQELSYSRFLQVPDEEGEFLTIEELKPAPNVQTTFVQHQQYQPSYYELPNIIE